jgi:hypothetical protein
MPHIVKALDWCTIDIVVHEARVFVEQRWLYSWQVQTPMAPWSLSEKRAFHKEVNKQIWASWSDRVKLSVAGTSEFAKKFATTRLPINLDIRWVLSDGQWTTTAWKMRDDNIEISSIDWGTRSVTLYANDMAPRSACTSAVPQVCTTGFRTMPHEFGHAIGNTAVLGRGDEYNAGSANLADTTSIMNIGTQLRTRHFRTLLEAMNTMIPGTTFAVHQIG